MRKVGQCQLEEIQKASCARCSLCELVPDTSLSPRLPGHGGGGGSVHLHRGASSAQLRRFLHGGAQRSHHRGVWQCGRGLQRRGLHHGEQTTKTCPKNCLHHYFTFKPTSLTPAAEIHLLLNSGHIILCAKWSDRCCWNAPLFFFCINSVGVVFFYATKLGSVNSQSYKPKHKAHLTSENCT